MWKTPLLAAAILATVIILAMLLPAGCKRGGRTAPSAGESGSKTAGSATTGKECIGNFCVSDGGEPSLEYPEPGAEAGAIASLVEAAEVDALLYRAGDAAPSRRTLRLQPGVWLLPPAAFAQPALGAVGGSESGDGHAE